MTSLLGRLLPLFVGAWRVEDLFTEAVARIFERRPDICLGLIRKISAREGWMTYGPNEPEAWPEVWNELNLATIANKEDHIFAIKQFFIESIRELREELTEFKKDNPGLPWNGGN